MNKWRQRTWQVEWKREREREKTLGDAMRFSTTNKRRPTTGVCHVGSRPAEAQSSALVRMRYCEYCPIGKCNDQRQEHRQAGSGMTKGLRTSAGLLRRRRPEEGLQGSFLSSSLSLTLEHAYHHDTTPLASSPPASMESRRGNV